MDTLQDIAVALFGAIATIAALADLWFNGSSADRSGDDLLGD